MKTLGEGSFGKVFLTHSTVNEKHKVAIKLLNKKKLYDQLDTIQTEIKILASLDHPNIVKYYETYNDKDYMYIVMEYISGGELLEAIKATPDQTISEPKAK